MDTHHFDYLTRSVSRLPSRRGLTAALALAAIGFPGLAEARKRKHKKKPKRNSFGCVNVGKFCKTDGQCCSGICEGKKDKKTCQAHDQSTCQAGQNLPACGGTGTSCNTSGGASGTCLTTTGNAGYCGLPGGMCVPCQTDVDCEVDFGPLAACIVCPVCEEFGGSICAGLGGD